MTDKPNEPMPEKLWIYDRNGKLEARDCSIVVGNVEYVRADKYDKLREALEYAKQFLEKPSIATEAAYHVGFLGERDPIDVINNALKGIEK